ncbi:T9SS type A sorting domain-containing protein [Calditrichota bacterium]
MFQKSMLIFIASLLVLSQVIAADLIQAIHMDTWRIVPLELDELDEDITIYEFDFEDDEDWSTQDLTGVGVQWHTSDFNAYDDGTSWWCGDEDLEGYNNQWLQYLESPELDLSNADESLELTFMMYLDCEETGGEPDGYDGWDGANVWYSTDGGDNWDVLEDPDPEYDSESLYSFGVEFGMGTGIAGWNGDFDHEWTEISFDLSDFTGEESFIIRFAFCSDGGLATPDGDYLSLFVDDILLADDDNDYLENDAEGVAEPDDLIGIEQIGNGDSWVLQDDEYYSETHAWQMTIEDQLLCAIVSPEIDIPFIDDYPMTFLTYWVYCDMPDWDGDDDNSLDDYYEIDISDDDGTTWVRLVYDYSYDNGEGDSGDEWVERTRGLEAGGVQTELIDLTPYEGETVRIRFVGNTDDNDDGGNGDGLFIDDVKIISSDRLDHDVGISVLHIPFPVTVDLPVPATVTIVNYGENQETYNAYWVLGNTPYVIGQNLTLDPTESVTVNLDADDDDEIDEWVPEDDGEFEIYACVLLEDDYPDNNIAETITVEILPEGEYEFGYDDRIPMFFTTRFETGEGPITHFEIPDELEPLKFMAIRVLWHENLEDEVDFDVHIFEGGEEPGEEIWEDTFTADTDDTYPDWHELDITGIPELLNNSDDFWVWFELTETVDDIAMPNLITSEELLYGEGHHYEFDGATLLDADTDWMIRVIGEDVQPPEAFDLESPEDGEEVDTSTPTLSWEEAEDPDDGDEVVYTLVWSVDDPDFTDPDSVSGIEETSYTFDEEQMAVLFRHERIAELDEFEDGVTVYWKVRAQDLNTSGIWSSPEDGWSFTVALPFPPQDFVLLSPQNGEILDTLDWLFTWETAIEPDDEVFYTVYISTEEDLSESTVEEAGTDTSILITGLEDDSQYWWAVHAQDEDTDGTWSDTIAFTTAWPQPPSVFNLLEPENNSAIELIDPFNIDFSWEESFDPDPDEDVTYTFSISVVVEDIDTTIEVTFLETPETQLILPEELGIQYWEESMNGLWSVTAVSIDQQVECLAQFSFEVLPYSRINEMMFTGIPTEWSIAAIYPNPFNPVLSVVIGLPENSNLYVNLFNIIGEEVALLASGTYQRGYHKCVFKANNLPSGIYFIQANVPEKLNSVRKVVLIK